MKRLLRFFYLIVLTMWVLSPKIVAAQSSDERVLSFDSIITINPDASLTISEKIRVRCAGEKIKQGISRDFPARYKDKLGHNIAVSYDLIEVSRDGQPENYSYSNSKDGRRLSLGDKGKPVAPGDYTYTLIYRTNRQVGFFSDHDELYLNATGNAWELPIDKAAVTIDLPNDGQVVSVDSFTGYWGEVGRDSELVWDYLGRALIRTTRVLKPHESLTIAAFWPKGYVEEPTAKDHWEYFLQDNNTLISALVSFMIIIGFFVFIRRRQTQPLPTLRRK